MPMMSRAALAALGAALGAALTVSPFAAGSSQAQTRHPPARVGELTCNISGGVGLIITSEKALSCTFLPRRGGHREAYVGTVRKFGLDVGVTQGGRLVWAVLAPTNVWHRGALAGSYAGATAEASVVAGGGANVLVGGSDNTISLQPLSVQAQRGVNLALGVSAIDLQPAR